VIPDHRRDPGRGGITVVTSHGILPQHPSAEALLAHADWVRALAHRVPLDLQPNELQIVTP
jgi:hypothetical protein